jgi:hypothetical protein
LGRERSLREFAPSAPRRFAPLTHSVCLLSGKATNPLTTLGGFRPLLGRGFCPTRHPEMAIGHAQDLFMANRFNF